jgi:hypothetical protein
VLYVCLILLPDWSLQAHERFLRQSNKVKRKTSSEACPCHDGEGLVLTLSFAFQVSHKGMVVLSNGRCVGVLWPYLPFPDRQGTLEERFGLLVLALLTVKHSQVIEAGRCVGVLWP